MIAWDPLCTMAPLCTRPYRRVFVVALALFGMLAFVPPVPRAPPGTTVRGFLEDLMDKLDGGDQKDDAWKDEMMREQQEILRKRRASGGFITEEDEEEIRQRRANIDGCRQPRRLEGGARQWGNQDRHIGPQARQR